MSAGIDFATGGDAAKDTKASLEAWRHGVLGALYQLKTKNQQGNQRTFYLSTTVMTIQLCYLPLSKAASFAWPTEFQVQAQTILEPFAFGYMTFPSSTAFLLLFGMAGLMTIAMITGIALLAYDESRAGSPASFAGITTGLAHLCRMMQTVLQIPFAALLTRMAMGEPTTSLPDMVVTVLSVISGILLALNTMVTALFALCVICNLPFRDNNLDATLYAAPHGRVEMLASLLRSSLAILFGTMTGTESQSTKNVLAALSVGGAAALVGIYLHWLPWFNQEWNRFSIGCYSIFLWTGLCAVVAQAVGDPTDSSSLLLFAVSLVFFVISMLSFAQARTNTIKTSTITKLISTPYLVELHLRLRHLTLKHGETFEFKDEAEAEFREAANLVQGSPFINLTVAGIVIATSRKVIFSLNLLRQARQNPLAFDLEFMLFYHNKLNQQKQTSSTSDMSLLEADALVAQARTALIQTLKYTSQFWKKVARRSFTVRSLLEHGAKVHHQALQVRQSLNKLTKLKAMNKESIQIQAMYHQYVMNDKDTAFKLLSKSSGNSDKGSSAAVCTISGDKATLGQILDLSKGMNSLFGFATSDLVGNNVNMLCPAPFQAVHDLFLQQFMGMDNDFESQARRVFGMHQQGHIMILDLEITPSINMSGELILAAKFSKVAQNAATHIILVDELTGIVTGMSQHAPQVLGVDEHEVYTLNTKLVDLIPDHASFPAGEERTNVQLATLPGMRFRYRSRQMEYKSKESSPVDFHLKVMLVWLTAQDNNMTIQAQVEAIQRREDLDEECEEGDDDSVAEPEEGEQPQKPEEESGGFALSFKDDTKPGPLTALSPTPGRSERRSFKETSGKQSTLASLQSPSSPGGSRSEKVRASKRGIRGMQAMDPDRRSVGSKSKRSARSGAGLSSFDGGSTMGSEATLDASKHGIRYIQRRIAHNLHRRDPRLVGFARFGRRFMVFFFCFMVANSLTMVMLFDSIRADLDLSKASLTIMHSISLVNVLVMLEHSPLALGDERERYFAGTHDLLAQTATSVKSLHAKTAAFADLADELDSAFHEPSLQVTLDAVEFRNVSYHVSVLEFVGHAENYLEQDGGQCLDSCKFILNNAHYDLLDTALRVAEGFEAYASTRAELIALVDLLTLVIVVVLLAGSFLQGYLPMFINNSKQRNRVGQAFLAIPENAARKLQTRTDKRLSIVQNAHADWFSMDQEELDFDEGHEGGEDAEDVMERSFLSGKGFLVQSPSEIRSAMATEQKPTLDIPTAETKKLLGSASAKVAPQGSSKKPLAASAKEVAQGGSKKPTGWRARRRAAKCSVEESCKNATRTMVNIAQVGITFWFVLAFFVTLARINAGHSKAVQEEDSVIFTSGLRYVLSSALLYWAALPVEIAPWERRTVDSHLAEWERVLHEMLVFDRALKYGDTALDVPAFKKTEGELYDLLFVDACEADCKAHVSGVTSGHSQVDNLKHGLGLALERNFELFTHALRAHKAYAANPTNDTLREAVEVAKQEVYELEAQLILQNQLERVVDIDIMTLEAEIVTTRVEKIIATLIFGVLLVLCQIVSARTVRRMDKDLKKSQTLLLMLPLQIFENVEEIRLLLSD